MTYQKSKVHRPYSDRYYSKIDTSSDGDNGDKNEKASTENHPNKEFIRYTQNDSNPSRFRGF